MKFKFCSDGDCPLWALAALHALGSLPVQLFRALLQHLLEEQPIDRLFFMDTEMKVATTRRRYVHHCGLPCHNMNRKDDGIMELMKDTSLSSREECARAAAVLRWTLWQAHRCACTGAQLSRDLLVLGVPRAHASALGDAADATREAYETNIRSNGFMINKVTDVSAAPGPEGAVDTIKLTLHSDEVFTGEQKTAELLVDKTLARTMLEELKNAYKRMEELDVES